MKKRELLIIVMLLLSLWVNFTILNKVEDQTNQMVNLRLQLDQLNQQLNHTSNQMNQMVAEKEWIQKTNFSLVTEESREDRMVVHGEFTFNELKPNQKPLIFHREKGTTDWTKDDLESLGGLNYAVQMTLSPEKVYEYQITAEGNGATGSTIFLIPQNVYGFPEKKVDISMSSVKDASAIRAQVYVGFAPAPIGDMTPVNVSIQIEKNGQLRKTVPLTHISGLDSEFSGTLEISSEDNLDISPNTELFIVTEFKNGVVLKEKNNEIFREGMHERIISEEKNL